MKTKLKKLRNILKKIGAKVLPTQLKQSIYIAATRSKTLSRLLNVPYDELYVFLKKRWNTHLKNVKKCKKNYAMKVRQLKQKNKIKVCFTVVYDSSFSLESLFQKMLQDSLFEPFILIIPDSYRGQENMFYQMEKTYAKLSQIYGPQRVRKSYDPKHQTWWDYTDFCDVLVPANPYDDMTLPIYGIHYAAQKNILPIYQSYGFENVKWSNYHAAHLREMHLCWKIYAEAKEVLHLYFGSPAAENVVISGYAKMDAFAQAAIKGNIEREREREREREQEICQKPDYCAASYFKQGIQFSFAYF